MTIRDPNRLTVPQVLPLVREYIRKPENCVGGSLHIVIEDCNLETEHIRYCAEDALERDDDEPK